MAVASISRVPAIFSSASCQGRLRPISSMAFRRLPAALLPKTEHRWSGPLQPAACAIAR